MLAEVPTTAERALETGTRGRGGDRTLEIDHGAEQLVLDELDALRDEGHQFVRLLRGARRDRLWRPRRAGDHRSDRRLAERQARHLALRPVDRRRGRADHGRRRVRVRARLRPVRDVVGMPGPWRLARRRAARPDAARTPRAATAGSRCSASKSADPRWVAGLDRVARTDRVPPAGAGHDRGLAVSGGRGPVRRMVTLRRCRGVDAAAGQLIVREAGGLVSFPMVRSAAWGAPHRRARARRLIAARSPEPRSTSSRGSPSDRLDRRRENRHVRRRDGGRGHRQRADRRPGRRSRPSPRRAWSPTPGSSRPGRCRRPRASAAGNGSSSNIDSMRLLLDPVLKRANERPRDRSGRRSRSGSGIVLSTEVGVVLGYLAQRVLGQYELVLLDEAVEDRPPRLLFVLPNLGQAVQAFGAEEERVHDLGGAARGHPRGAVRRRACGCTATSPGWSASCSRVPRCASTRRASSRLPSATRSSGS